MIAEKGKIIYFVRDNGVGFDDDFLEKIFVLFHRLHRSDYAGTGVELAMVQRVVQRHGGKVWVESTEGRGPTFFTLQA